MAEQHPWDGKPITKADYWPCACVKHEDGKLTHVKANHPGVASCRTCKGKRPVYGKYYCKACDKLLPRDSDKLFIMTTCQETGNEVRAYRI